MENLIERIESISLLSFCLRALNMNLIERIERKLIYLQHSRNLRANLIERIESFFKLLIFCFERDVESHREN